MILLFVVKVKVKVKVKVLWDRPKALHARQQPTKGKRQCYHSRDKFGPYVKVHDSSYHFEYRYWQPFA